jgi:hypothetical protein
MKQLVSILVLLQGLSPLLVMGCLTPARNAYIVLAIIYAGIAWGLWRAKRWVFILAILIMLAQVVTFSSPSYTWDPALGLKAGPYFTSQEYGVWCYVGAHFDFDYHRADYRIAKVYPFIQGQQFVWVNLFGIVLVILMLVALGQIRRQPPNTALEPTPTAP